MQGGYVLELSSVNALGF